MAKKNVILFGGYADENRKSMEIYSSRLKDSIEKTVPRKWKIDIFNNVLPDCCRTNFGLLLRFSKYFLYPYQVSKSKSSVIHIFDHSYAHLLYFINANKSIVTVHDLMPIIGWKKNIPGLRYKNYPILFKLAMFSLRKAKAIIAVSENTKRDLEKYVGLDSNKITVIYNGVDESFVPIENVDKDLFCEKFNISSENYSILITGNQQYKNHITSFNVIKNLEKITDRSIQLVWLGSSDEEYEKISKKVKLTTPVIRVFNLSKTELNGLYNCVDCLLFPSWYEGFGWPPLEAMACGTPVVSSNSGPLPEIVSNAALTAAPDDIDAFVRSVYTVLTNEEERNKLIKLGRKNISRFTWGGCAKQVDQLYDKINDNQFT